MTTSMRVCDQDRLTASIMNYLLQSRKSAFMVLLNPNSIPKLLLYGVSLSKNECQYPADLGAVEFKQRP